MNFIEAIKILKENKNVSITNDSLRGHGFEIILVNEYDNHYILQTWNFEAGQMYDFNISCEDILDDTWEMVV